MPSSPPGLSLHDPAWIAWSALQPIIDAGQRVGAGEAYRGALAGRPGDVLVRLFKLDAATRGGAATSDARFQVCMGGHASGLFV